MMAPDFPSDLIRDIQIGLRKAAGIPSYDPSDPALPSVPSIEEAVAAIDPSLPDYLCCKRCHGGLLRGINSTLCIYCGAEQRKEGVSRTFSFNSTEGYRKFLQSLNLDGSEIVNLEDEPKNSRKGQDSPKGGVTLSNILDLELIWPRNVEESDNSTSSKTPSQAALVSLSHIDLDNFFSDQKNVVSSGASASHTTNFSPRMSSHDAYLSSVHSNTFLSSTINETAISSQNVTSVKVNPREQDVNPHIDISSSSQKFVFFEGQFLDAVNSSDAKSGDSDDAFTDWETNFQSASSVTFEAKPKPIDFFHKSVDFESANSTKATVQSAQIDPFQNTSYFQSDSFTDLTLESKAIDLFQNSAGFPSTNFEIVETESRFIDLFQKFSKSESTDFGMDGTDSRPIDHLKISGAEKSDQSSNIGIISDKNWFQDDMSHISTKLKEIDQLESISSTYGNEIKNEEVEVPVRISWTQDDLFSNSANEINNGKTLNHHDDDDLFDDWQDFTTSTNALGNFSSLQPLSSDKVHILSSEVKLGDLEDIEFGSFVQSDSVSSALNDLQSSSDVNSIEARDSVANRTNQRNEETGNASIYIDKDVSNASKYKVDMILAQMPDLSFMLEESLCIPKKPSSSELNT